MHHVTFYTHNFLFLLVSKTKTDFLKVNNVEGVISTGCVCAPDVPLEIEGGSPNAPFYCGGLVGESLLHKIAVSAYYSSEK